MAGYYSPVTHSVLSCTTPVTDRY